VRLLSNCEGLMLIEGPRTQLSRFGAAIGGAVAVGATGLVAAIFIEPGLLASHMALHIAAMNVIAPLVAVWLCSSAWLRPGPGCSAMLWTATLLQMALLWGWHSPALQYATHTSPLVALGLHSALLVAAIAFWSAVIASSNRWQAILALLLSGKLACLVGALLVFSPRLLYAPICYGQSTNLDAASALADQHLAGLLMLAACPLSYILAAIILTTQEIANLPTLSQVRRERHPVGG
jgi:putative membrane protein